VRQPRRARESGGPHSERGTDGVRSLTAGDLARLLRVDLKTIHNWVHQGHLFARRTEGRHLRFERVEVVRFLRRLGHKVPAPLGKAVPRVLISGPGAPPRGGRASRGPRFFDSVLELAFGAYEVFVLALDEHEPSLTEALLDALRARPETHALSLVGTSRRVGRLRAFIRGGGDVALPSGSSRDIAAAARFLTGGRSSPPHGALLREELRSAVNASWGRP
jgi:excisionase family DNA binding protein